MVYLVSKNVFTLKGGGKVSNISDSWESGHYLEHKYCRIDAYLHSGLLHPLTVALFVRSLGSYSIYMNSITKCTGGLYVHNDCLPHSQAQYQKEATNI